MNFLACYDRITRATVDAGLRPIRAHITTASFTAKITGAPAWATHIPVPADDPFFSEIRKSKFSNSSMEFETSRFPSVRLKVFNEGRVHVSGCKSDVEAETVIREACRLTRVPRGPECRAEDLRLIMVNFAVDLGPGSEFTLGKFAEVVRELNVPGTILELPERPPCAMLSLPKSYTIMAYASGKAYVSATSLDSLAKAYEIFASVVRKLPRGVSSGIARKPRNVPWTRLALEQSPGSMHEHPPTTLAKVPGCAYCENFGNCFSTG